MEQDRTITEVTIDWQGIALSVTYTADWLGMSQHAPEGSAYAHLEIRSADGGALPITATGYRSQFIPPMEVTLAGGAVAYVRAWLDEAAKSPEWQAHRASAGQLSLF